MNTIRTFIISGFANWKTTLIGAFIALLTAYNTGVFDGKTGQELWLSIAIFLWGFVSRDANKSSQDSGVRKPTFEEELLESVQSGIQGKGKRNRDNIEFRFWWIIPFLCLTSCATRTDGTATFIGLDSGQWLAVGKEAGKGAILRAIPEYQGQRAMSHAKQPINVQP